MTRVLDSVMELGAVGTNSFDPSNFNSKPIKPKERTLAGAVAGLVGIAGGITGATFAAKEVVALSALPLVDATLGNIVKAGGCLGGAVVSGVFAANGLRTLKESLSSPSHNEPLSRAVGLVGLAGGVAGSVFASKAAIALSATPVVDALMGDLVKAGGCVAGAVISALVAVKGMGIAIFPKEGQA